MPGQPHERNAERRSGHRRESDASARMDQTMSRGAALLDRRAELDERSDRLALARAHPTDRARRDSGTPGLAEERADGAVRDERNKSISWELTREARGEAR